MPSKLRYWMPFVIFLLLITLFKFGLHHDPNLLPAQLIGKPVPPFSVSLLNQKQRVNEKIFQDKITLLNIWASWCSACQIEHPILVDLAKQDILQLVGVDYKDNAQTALKYLTKMGNPFAQIIDDSDGKLAMLFGVYGTPESFLIDRKGLVRYRYVGPLTLDVLERDVLPRIKQLAGEG